MRFTPNFSRQEWKRGLIAMCLSMLLVPGLLAMIPGLSNARLNFLSYLSDLMVTVIFLGRFLKKNIIVALDHPFSTIYLAILGGLGITFLTELVSILTFRLLPEYVNLNNVSIQSQLADCGGLGSLSSSALSSLTLLFSSDDLLLDYRWNLLMHVEVVVQVSLDEVIYE